MNMLSALTRWTRPASSLAHSAGDDARDDVEGDQALGAGIVAIDGEGDADAAEDQVGLGTFAGDGLGRLRRSQLANSA
jgi:hypothetical protein